MKAAHPEEIGGYRILSSLGRGGMGAVYRARDGEGRTVALKLLHAHLDDPEARERLSREVAALQRVRHRGVARVLDAEIESTEAFVVTELVAGRDLAKHVRQRGPFPPAELAALAARLREALAVVHEAGVLHRDLTPGNVMITPDGPVLIDFGLAQALEDARVTSTGLVTGTPGYVAPELLDGRQPSVESDWWGWAAVLTFAATGRAPFGKGAIGAILTRVRAGEPALDGVGPRTADALRGGLAVEPGDRSAPADVVAALEAAAEAGDGLDDEADPAGDEPTLADAAGDEPAAAAEAADGGADVGDDMEAAEGAEAAEDAEEGAQTRVLDAHDGGTAVLVTADADADADADVADGADGDEGAESTDEAWTDEEWADDEWADGEWADDGTDEAVPADEDWAEEDWADDWAAGGVEPSGPGRRAGTVAALALPLLALGLARPGAALAVAIVIAVLVRSVGLTADALLRRRARRGARPADVTGAALTWPWYLVRATLGVLPAVIVGGAVVVMVGGVLWWLAGAGHWVVAAPAPGEPVGVLDANAVWVGRAAVALLVAVGLTMLWFGPTARATRAGARWVLSGVAPGRVGTLAAVVVGVALAAALATVMLGQDVAWWPMAGPPDLG